MLMLAVTVMIAAIVSTYAGGFSGGAEKSPQSSIRATPELAQNNNPKIYFEHEGGDPFISAPSMWFYVPVITRSPCLPTMPGAVRSRISPKSVTAGGVLIQPSKPGIPSLSKGRILAVGRDAVREHGSYE